MKNNNQPMTPSGLFSARLRFNSINSPFISPLQIVPSPCLNDRSDNHFSNPEFNQFQLQQPPYSEVQNQQPQQNHEEPESNQSVKSIQYPVQPEIQHLEDLILDQNNILQFVLNHVNRNPQAIEEAKARLKGYGTDLIKQLFDYLVNKFKKLRKTKEELVKYCIRKSFKHITNKLRAAHRQLYINMENNEVVGQYFQMHCEGDTSISMPFKKNSEEKTMNSTFLKKIFKCRQYNIDYRQFLKNFPEEYNNDNRKRIKSMNEAIKKCFRNKSLKSLDQYKRLPWSTDLLEKIFDFAVKLMEHSPFKKENLINHGKIKGNKDQKQQNKISQQISKKQQGADSSNMSDQFEIIKNVPNKKQVIILTPPARPLNEPQNTSGFLDLDMIQ